MRPNLGDFWRDQVYATAIEHGLIAIMITTGVNAIGAKLSTKFTTLSSNLK